MENRVALVTGGTRGIGLAMARKLKAQGIRVYITGHVLSDKTILQEFPCYYTDLSNPENCYRIIHSVLDEYGRIDILVNNAGAQHHAKALSWTNTDFEKSIALMLTAPFVLSKIFALKAEDGGHIVNILSTAAFQGARNIVGYVAAKHGLLGLTRALAVEWAPLIHVNAIAPGITETDMIADLTNERRAMLESITPVGRFCRPDEIADALIYLVNSTGVYGQTITVDGGWMVKNG